MTEINRKGLSLQEISITDTGERRPEALAIENTLTKYNAHDFEKYITTTNETVEQVPTALNPTGSEGGVFTIGEGSTQTDFSKIVIKSDFLDPEFVEPRITFSFYVHVPKNRQLNFQVSILQKNSDSGVNVDRTQYHSVDYFLGEQQQVAHVFPRENEEVNAVFEILTFGEWALYRCAVDSLDFKEFEFEIIKTFAADELGSEVPEIAFWNPRVTPFYDGFYTPPHGEPFTYDSPPDIHFEDRNLVIAENAEAVGQHVNQRLKTFSGEWFLDKSAGVTWLDEMLGGNYDPALAEALTKNEIIETDGVTEIESFSVKFDRTLRGVTSQGISVKTVYDESAST